MDPNAAWYIAKDGKEDGPYTKAQLDEKLAKGEIGPDTWVYGPGVPTWQPLGKVEGFGGRPGAPPAPPRLTAHEIDYEIFGEEMQFVEITLDPGEATVAEAGAFMYMEPGIRMETIFGDGSAKAETQDFLGKLMSAGKRVLTGESLFMTVFWNDAKVRQKVAFASPYPGRIIPVDLRQHNGRLLCQKDSFLCAAKGVSVGLAFQKRMGAGLFGGEGFILEKLEGDGLMFVHAGGHVVARDLAAGETLRLDTGCLVAFEQHIDFDVQFVGGIKTALFGGEGLFFATLTGPGRIFIQSLPFSRLASRIFAAVPRGGRGRREEGSILDRVGGLGNLIDGD
ncbi:MAG: TIGR00266 family protein [bacterium]